MNTFIKQFWHNSEVELIEEVNRYAEDNKLDILHFTSDKTTHTYGMNVLFKKRITIDLDDIDYIESQIESFGKMMDRSEKPK